MNRKHNLKSINALLISLVFCFSFSSCNSSPDQSPTSSSQLAFYPKLPFAIGYFNVEESEESILYTRRIDQTQFSREKSESWVKFGSSRLSETTFRVYVDEDTNNIIIEDNTSNTKKQLTNNGCDNRYPSISPDGSLISFASDCDGDFEIFVMGIEGNDLKQLTENDLADRSPVWSPDGNRILFESEGYKDYDRWNLFIIDASGEHLTQLTYELDENFITPLWSPDGSSIVYADWGGSSFYIVNADGSNLQKFNVQHGIYSHLESWSPDNKWILYSNTWRAGEDEYYHEWMIANVENGDIINLGRSDRGVDDLFWVITDQEEFNSMELPTADTMLSTTRENSESIDFSLYTDPIVFYEETEDNTDYQLHMVNSDGSDYRKIDFPSTIIGVERTHAQDPLFSPDRKYLAFSSRNHLYLIDLENNSIEKIYSARRGSFKFIWSADSGSIILGLDIPDNYTVIRVGLNGEVRNEINLGDESCDWLGYYPAEVGVARCGYAIIFDSIVDGSYTVLNEITSLGSPDLLTTISPNILEIFDHVESIESISSDGLILSSSIISVLTGTEMILLTSKENDFLQLMDIYMTDGEYGSTRKFQWSPGGQTFAYIKEVNGARNLYIMDIDKREELQLTFSKNEVEYYKWSPDGSKIAYMIDNDSDDCDLNIYVIDIFSGEQLITIERTYSSCQGSYARSFDWSPDSSSIVYSFDASGAEKLFITNINSGESRQLFSEGAFQFQPIWSSYSIRDDILFSKD